jgi:hypothetical protein
MLHRSDVPDALAPFGGQFPQAPVLAPPQAPGGLPSSARVAPLPPSFAPVHAWLERLFFLQGGQDGRGGLRHMNQLAHTYTQEAQSYRAVARAIHGVASLLQERGRGDPLPGDGGYGAVVAAAERLLQALDQRLPAISPVTVSHAAYCAQWRTDAANLHAHLADREAWQHIRAFMDDGSLPAAQRWEVWGYIKQALALASDDLANGPRQRILAEEIEGALTEPSSSVLWPAVVAGTTVFTNLVGRMAGPDTAVIVFLKVVATYDVVRAARLPRGQVDARWHRFVRWLSRSTGPSALDEEGFIAAIEAWRNASFRNRASLQEASRRVDVYCENLKDRLNLGPGLSALSTLLSAIQLIAAYGAVTDDEPAWRVANDLTPGLLATSTGVVLSINRALTTAAGEGTRLAVYFPQVQTWARAWAEAIETGAGATVLSCAFGVTAIVGGGFLITSGNEQHDRWMVRIGRLQVASGLLIVIGVMGVPGLQPLGAVLGFVAAALALYDMVGRQAGERVCRRLAVALHEQPSGWDQARLRTTIGVEAEVDALQRAIDAATFAPIPAHTVAQREDLVRRLVDLGVPERDAREMIDVSAEMMQETRGAR